MNIVADRVIRFAMVIAVALSVAPAACAEPAKVVINEIMYHPPGDLEDLQYIELFNAGNADSDLSGWSFNKGVKFVFPKNIKLAAGGYLVACRNRKVFVEHYGREVPLAGEFEGHLSHNGERLELSDLIVQGDLIPALADARTTASR